MGAQKKSRTAAEEYERLVLVENTNHDDFIIEATGFDASSTYFNFRRFDRFNQENIDFIITVIEGL